MPPKKKKYKAYLGPDVDPDELEPRTSRWRHQSGVSEPLVEEEVETDCELGRENDTSSNWIVSEESPTKSMQSEPPNVLAQSLTGQNELDVMHVCDPPLADNIVMQSSTIASLLHKESPSVSACPSQLAVMHVSVPSLSADNIELQSSTIASLLEKECSSVGLACQSQLAVMHASVPSAEYFEVQDNEANSFESTNENDGSSSELSEDEVMEEQLEELLSGEEDEQSEGDLPLEDAGEPADNVDQPPEGNGQQPEDEPQPQGDQDQQLDDENQPHENEDHIPNQNQEPPAQDGQDIPGQIYNQNPSHPKLLRKMGGEYEPVIEAEVNVSRNDALYMALGLARRENFSNSALCNSINLINALFNSPILPETVDALDGILLSNNHVRYFFYCMECYEDFGELDHKNVKRHLCPNCGANNVISDLRKAHFFVLFSLPHQLENMFRNHEICNALLSPADAVNRGRAGFITDLYDGSIYKKFAATVSHLNCQVLSFHFCVDGSPLAKSSLCSIWPIQLALNELPPKLRMSNLLLGGLWFGSKQAKMDLLLKPFVDQFRNLGQGFNIKIGNNVKHCYAFCIGCCVDSGARGKVQGVKTHSGYHSCNWCIICGQWIGGGVRFPLTGEHSQERTHEQLVTSQRNLIGNPVEDGANSENEEYEDDPGVPEAERHLLGVNAVSPLINLPHLRDHLGETIPSFNMVDSFFVDSMHLLDLGISKFFLTRWMEDYGHEYYIKYAEGEINQRLKLIRPPLEFRRLPRVLAERPRYNAKECQNWMMFCCVPVLTGILQNKFLTTWLHLIQAIYLLNLREVCIENLAIADRLITVFLSRTQEYYHEADMVFNLHILSHIVAHVTRNGPLWASNAYCFEDGNGRLKRIVHSSQGIPHQIIRALSWAEAMKLLESVVSVKAKHYVSKITQPEQHRQRSFTVGDTRLIGKSEACVLSNEERFHCENFHHEEGNLERYHKIVYKNCSFTDNQDRSLRHDNSVAQLSNKSLVLIRKILFDLVKDEVFLFVSDIHFETILVPPVGVRLDKTDHFMRKITHINEETRYINCSDLSIVCFRATMPSGDFVAPFPNVYNRQ